MAYSGKYKVKNPKKYLGDHTKVVYRSGWERSCFMWCDAKADIKGWSSEEVVIPYYYDVDKKYHRYFMDLKIVFKDGKTLLVEIKPDKQTRIPKNPNKSKRYISEALTYIKNQCKWEAAKEYAKDRGWHFEIWTEVELRKMGLLAKPVPGKLKPYKPYKPYARSKK
jgi:hypothetical protein